MRLPSLRRKLVSRAHGDVLEVSIGTGRNLDYYDWQFAGQGQSKTAKKGGKEGLIRSFTAIDKSADMLEVAHDKFAHLFPGTTGVRWVVGDAEREIPSPLRSSDERSGNLVNGKYDTVIQTMGLCSVGDPVRLLRSLGTVVKEEDGRILLLEHGRGRWKWLNDALDRFAERHAEKFGCWWNRDMEEIVKESGLEVVDMRSIWWHGGTTWWIELKKPKEKMSKENESTQRELDQEVKPRGWW
jgi:methyltransferase OMS1